jgi:hypothetical protein
MKTLHRRLLVSTCTATRLSHAIASHSGRDRRRYDSISYSREAPRPRKSSPRSRPSSMSTSANRASKGCGAARTNVGTNERPTEPVGFSVASYHRGFWASKELSSVRAAMTNLRSHFVDPSNQSQTTQSPSTAVTVITGPPELRRTVSPGLKGIFDSPAASW